MGVREVGEVEERDGLALARRERGDGPEHPRAQQGIRLVGRHGLVGHVHRRLARRTSGEVAPDPAQPAAEGVVVAQPVEARHGDQQRVLGRVGRASAGAQQRGAVALGQRGEGIAVTHPSGGHERGIGHTSIAPRAYPWVTHAAIMDCR